MLPTVASPSWLSVIHRSPITHLVGGAVYLGVQFVQVMIIGRLLGGDILGYFGYCLAVITPALLLATWHVRHARVMDGAGAFAWSAYAHLRTIGLLVAAVLLGVVAMLTPGLAAQAPLFAALLFFRLGEAWIDLPYSAYQRSGEVGRIGVGVALRALLGLAAFITALSCGGTLPWAITAQAVASLTWWAAWEHAPLHAMREIGERADGQRSSVALLRHVWPLGITVAMGSLIAAFPRIALTERHGAEEGGRYLLLGYLFIPALLAQNAFQQAGVPLLAAEAASGTRDAFFRRLVRLALPQILAPALMAVAVLVVQHLMGWSWIVQGFALRGAEVLWFGLGLMLSSAVNVVGLAMDAIGAYRGKLLYWTVLTVLGVGMTWWWGVRGIEGAGMASVAAGMVGCLIGGWWLARVRFVRREGVQDAC
jgi:O-antigen/teichoic acid export membrane protein